MQCNPLTLASRSLPLYAKGMNTRQSTDFLYGVNLGGWLVAEKWMTPSVFAKCEAGDEYTLVQTDRGRRQLATHHRVFIQESDIEWLASHGINALRVPVGYWLFDGVYDDGIAGEASIDYLDAVVAWAEKYQMRVLIDLHAAPGSQNGHDHSGRTGKAAWYRSAQHRKKTLEVLVQIAERYREHGAVWGIELLNEPRMGLFQMKLRAFYRQAYAAIRAAGRPGLVVVFHDAFTPRLMSGALWSYDPSFPVMMDIHWYQFLDIWRRVRPREWYFGFVSRRGRMLERVRQRHGVIVGEWSAVLSHEFLRGTDEETRTIWQREHVARQLAAYSMLDGWFYWSYKTEGEGEWNFRSMVEQGLLRLDR